MLLGVLSSCLKGVLLSIQYVICAGSICKMKQNHHFMVPEADFQLLQGEDKLTLYQVCKSDIWQAASYRHCRYPFRVSWSLLCAVWKSRLGLQTIQCQAG